MPDSSSALVCCAEAVAWLPNSSKPVPNTMIEIIKIALFIVPSLFNLLDLTMELAD